MRRFRGSWVMRLPAGVREQPGWIFIGFFCAAAGLTYLLGVSQSNVALVLGDVGLRVWGGFLCLSGLLVAGSTWAMNRPLERLALRFLSLGLAAYAAWVVLAVSASKATLTIVLSICLIGVAEVRIAVLKASLKPLPKLPGVKR